MTESGALDASTGGSFSDAWAEASVDAPTLAADSRGEVGAVDASCASCNPPNLCRQGVCRTAVQTAGSSRGDSRYSFQTSDTVWCVQVRGSICGQVTQASVLLGVAVAANVRLGVYDDNAGTPSILLSQSSEVFVNGGSIDGVLAPAVAIDCGAPKPAVWVCLVSSANGMEVLSVANSRSMWTSINLSPNLRAEWLDSGLPDACPAGAPSSADTPLVYLWAVQ
ncbi:MAG: hypothetical protein M3O50_14930 [Myxococcota bacterium]|nr:hypothetical protein [Myxococcota bacterium]